MDSNASRDRKTEALHALAREKHESRDATTRRNLVRTAIGGGAAALLFGSATGPAAAQSGVVEATSAGDPLLKIRADQMVLTPRTSDVSSPADGTTWYRSDL